MTGWRLHLGLFILTWMCTTLAGAEWSTNTSLFFGNRTMGWHELLQGLPFSLTFLFILTAHEFGHYFTARYHDIRVSLPYYIPLWLGFLAIPSIGTVGAFIRIKEPMYSRQQYFDVGVAGPIVGFVAALFVLSYGFTHLPDPSHIFSIHPEYKTFGADYAQHVYKEGQANFGFGNPLLFDFFTRYVADAARLPHPYEMVHYPYLWAGYLALFLTALNLLPIGQLDGGHILYALVGKARHRVFSRIFFLALLIYASIGVISFEMSFWAWAFSFLFYTAFMYFSLRHFTPSPQRRLIFALAIMGLQLFLSYFFPDWRGYQGWLLFAFLLGGVLGLDHPSTPYPGKLSFSRKCVALAALLIFILCFSFEPFVLNPL